MIIGGNNGAKRTKYPMSDFIRAALNERGLMDISHSRPSYQQNDYIGSLWFMRAKNGAAKHKRLAQMLGKFESGAST